MEVKINVDETMFKDVIESELKAFSKEELHEIIRECIVEALHDNDVLKSLFVNKKKDYFGNYTYNEPSQIMKDAVKTIDLSPAYKEIQENIIATLKADYHKILENVMFSAVIDGIENNWNFQQQMTNAIQTIMRQRINN